MGKDIRLHKKSGEKKYVILALYQSRTKFGVFVQKRYARCCISDTWMRGYQIQGNLKCLIPVQIPTASQFVWSTLILIQNVWLQFRVQDFTKCLILIAIPFADKSGIILESIDSWFQFWNCASLIYISWLCTCTL